MTDQIGVVELEAQQVVFVTLRTDMENLGDALETALLEAWEYTERQHLEVTGPPLTRYHVFSEEGIELSAGFPVTAASSVEALDPPVNGDGAVRAADSSVRAELGELPACAAASVTYVGSYLNLPQAYRALGEWIVEQGLTPAGAPWEVYTSDPAQIADPEKWETRVYWPVR